MNKFILLLACLIGAWPLTAQLIDLTFAPDYLLPGNAANQIGPRPALITSQYEVVDWPSSAPLLMGQVASECLENFLPVSKKLPSPPYTVESWSLYHVNQPVGMAVIAGDSQNPDWISGHYGRHAILRTQSTIDSCNVTRGWKKYWLHQATVVTKDSVHYYFNGHLQISHSISTKTAGGELQLCFYLNQEPYMEAANLLKRLRIYDLALSPTQIQQALSELENEVEKGWRYPNHFHFTAGPYLHYLRPDGVNLSWETNRPLASAEVMIGTRLPLEQSLKVSLSKKADGTVDPIQVYALENLEPETAYFYELVLVSATGDTIRSNPLTFKTAPAQARPFTFAVLGDTEARPHINNRLGQLIWGERPSFLLNLGDLTDGGKAPHKFEWNLEYFTGMDALTSRLPIYTVPGNGEGDLYWYEQYHQYPDLGDVYTFVYGDVAFFMLNSNQKAEFAPGGRQYRWLQQKLKTSKARYKIVAHHHAPYSSDENDYGNSWSTYSTLGDTAIRKIVPLYEQYGVDLEFFGHLHTYERTQAIRNGQVDQQNGVVYIQAGGGGGNLEDFAPTRSWFGGKTYAGHHYLTVAVDARGLHVRMYDSEGRLKDLFTLD